MVTKKIEEVIFQRPVKTGNLIKIYGSVENIGNTSITINLEARKHNVYTGVQDLVCSTKMVFVRIDDEGAPVPISERVKKRYDDRVKLFGRGLLTPEEMIIERSKKRGQIVLFFILTVHLIYNLSYQLNQIQNLQLSFWQPI